MLITKGEKRHEQQITMAKNDVTRSKLFGKLLYFHAAADFKRCSARYSVAHTHGSLFLFAWKSHSMKLCRNASLFHKLQMHVGPESLVYLCGWQLYHRFKCTLTISNLVQHMSALRYSCETLTWVMTSLSMVWLFVCQLEQ